MLETLRLLDGRGYGPLMDKHGIIRDWPFGLAKAQTAVIDVLIIMFVANVQTTQVDKTLRAARYLREGRKLTSKGPGVFEFTGDDGTYTVDLNNLTCTCPLYQGRLEGKVGMCSHLIVALAKYGVAILSNPVNVLQRSADPDLLEDHPLLGMQFAGLPERLKPAALALVAAWVIGAETGSSYNRPLIEQCLLAIEHFGTALPLSDVGTNRYFYLDHYVYLDTMTCPCVAFTEARLCEGILLVAFAKLLAE